MSSGGMGMSQPRWGPTSGSGLASLCARRAATGGDGDRYESLQRDLWRCVEDSRLELLSLRSLLCEVRSTGEEGLSVIDRVQYGPANGRGRASSWNLAERFLGFG